MRMLNAVLIFAAGFAAGRAFASRDIDRRCNRIVEKEFEAFKAFQEENEEKESKRKAFEEEDDISEEVIEEEIDDIDEDDEETVEEDPAVYKRVTKLYSNEEENTPGVIIPKSEFGVLNYETRTLELFGDMTVEDTYGNRIAHPVELLGISDLEDLYASDDQTSAYVRNDEDHVYYEVIREV